MAKLEMFKYETNVDRYSAGDVLLKHGEPPDLMYIVQEGEIDVLSPDGTLIESLGPGDIVGEMALVDKAPRSADVVAKTDCVVVPIDEEAFKRHVHATPFFALQVLRITVDRLRRQMANASA